MKYIKDFGAVIAALLGGTVWSLYIVNHCTEKLSPNGDLPSVVSFIILFIFSISISVIFTRIWLVIPIVGIIPIFLLYFNFVKDITAFGLPTEFIWLAMVLPLVIITAGSFVGSRLRNHLCSSARNAGPQMGSDRP